MPDENKRYTFIISDESVNVYGYRVLTSGIDLSQMEKNPIALWMHQRASRWDSKEDQKFPIGRWFNLRKDGGKLIGDLEFDGGDEFAMKIKDKVEAGLINMASLGAEPITTSNDPGVLLPGQSRETVTQCLMLEASLVDIGGNLNAVRLYKDGALIELSAERLNETIKMVNIVNNHKKTNMKKIALFLGLAEDASEDAIMLALTGKDAKIRELEGKIGTLELAAENAQKAKVIELVNGDIVDRKINADKKENYITLGNQIGAESLKNVFADMSGAKKITEQIIPGSEGSAAVELKTFDDYYKLGLAEVLKLRTEEPDKYRKLYKEKYGREPEIE